MKAVLANGAARTVPFGGPQRPVEAACELADQPEQLAIARPEARQIGSLPRPPAVASVTAAVPRAATPSPSLPIPLQTGGSEWTLPAKARSVA